MALTAVGLTKHYPGLTVLGGLDLRVADGETVAIRGTSGTGKSTLLHCLGLLDHLDGGTIDLNGVALHDLPKRHRPRVRARSIGFVFQAFNLLPEFTVLENVLMSARAANAPLATATTHARELLERVGLGGRAGGDVRTLSGGERQRVGLCRALLNKPSLLLADEPTGNLDPATAAVVLEQMLALAREHGSSVVIVTHDPAIAARADRTLELSGGKLVAAA